VTTTVSKLTSFHCSADPADSSTNRCFETRPNALDVAAFDDRLATECSHTRSALRILQEIANVCGHSIYIAYINQKSVLPIANEIGHTTDACRNDRQASRHRL
jgi:hypothetical protein